MKDYNEYLRTYCKVLKINEDDSPFLSVMGENCFDLIFVMIENPREKYNLNTLLEIRGLDADEIRVSNPRYAAFLRKLANADILTKETVNNRTVFSISKTFLTKMECVKNAESTISTDDLVKRLNKEEAVKDAVYNVDIKKDIKTLIQYLQHIARIGTSVYSLKERRNTLISERDKAFIDELDDYVKANMKLDTLLSAKQKDIDALRKKISNPPKKKNSIKVSRPSKPVEPVFTIVKPEEPVYTKPGLFNKKKVEANNASLKAKFEKALSEYNAAQIQYQKDKDTYDQALITYKQAIAECDKHEKEINQKEYEKALTEYESQKDQLQSQLMQKEQELADFRQNINIERDKLLIKSKAHQLMRKAEYEIDYIEEELRKNIKAQNKLYSLGVLYGKYRNYVAVSSFCDYFMSGRCESLEGPDGAYNLYESESRADIVISKLDTIVESLEKIKENQFFIYNELETANTQLALINGQLLVNNILQAEEMSKLDVIADNTSQTALNTKVAAFYSKKNAELTDALGFLTAL